MGWRSRSRTGTTMSDAATVDIRVPGDKSISHRALMLATLASGTSRIRGLLNSADPRSTAAAMRALGSSLPETSADELMVEGLGLRGLRPPVSAIDCGNSGTTARLLLGILAGQSFQVELTGDDSLRSRPMRRVTEPLRAMGATVEEIGAPDRLPLRIHGGPLEPIVWDSPAASAQVKSAVLLAGLVGGVRAEVREPVLSRDHTERMLRAMGVRVLSDDSAAGAVAVVEPVDAVLPLDLTVPGDPSSAAFFLALGALARRGSVRVQAVGINPGRAGFLHALRRMGAPISIEAQSDSGGEPLADLIAEPSRLRGIEVTAAEVPSMVDELPMLAVLAARAEGETRIRGAGELRVKETDRIAALVENLRGIGVQAEELADGLAVIGSDAPLAGTIRTYGDHRIAMAFGVLGAVGNASLRIDDPGCAAVSYPGFWQDLDDVTRELER